MTENHHTGAGRVPSVSVEQFDDAHKTASHVHQQVAVLLRLLQVHAVAGLQDLRRKKKDKKTVNHMMYRV